MNTITAFLLVYLVTVNLAGFVLMGIDKKKAIRNAWRIPEAHLFLCAFIGGSIGSLLGMRFFRHKTRHPKFTIGMPAILILQLTILIVLYTRFL